MAKETVRGGKNTARSSVCRCNPRAQPGSFWDRGCNCSISQRRSGHSCRSRCRHHRNGASDFEVMLNDFNCSCPIYIACGYTDLRRGIDGLASIVETQFKMDPFQKAIFLFCGRRRDRLKALLWEGDGFLLLYKRLENGSFQWPRNKNEVQTLTPQQYRWLMEGLKIEQPKANKMVSGISMT